MRKTEPEIAAKEARPGTPRADDGLAGNLAFLSDDAGHLAGCPLDRTNGAFGQHRAAEAFDGARNGGYGFAGLGPSIRRRVERPFPLPAFAADMVIDLFRRQNSAIELERPCVAQPILVISQVGFRLGQVKRAALVPTDILFDVLLDILPNAKRFDNRRDFTRIAALLANIAPVPR